MRDYIPNISEPTRRWIRFLALLAALALLCWIAYALRSVFTPVIAGLVIAYILNPLVTWLEHRCHIARLHTVVVVFALLVALLAVGGAYITSHALAQIHLFQANFPGYVEDVGAWISKYQSRTTSAATTLPTALHDNWWAQLAPLLKEHGVAVARSAANTASGFLMNFVNVISLIVLVPLFTFFFLWRFNDMIAAVRDHLPAHYRDNIIHVVGTIDGAISNFFRGRIIVCAIVGLLTAIGWSLIGVPYALVLGLIAGTLNLVPFMSMLALPPALFFAYIGAADAGTAWALPVCLTMGVYMLVQTLESFLLSPAIEGRSSGLHPLAIVIAIMIGAELAGLLGMLLAIPVASTLKTFAAELVLPELRRLAKPATADLPQSAPPPANDAPPTEPEQDKDASA